MAYRRKSPSKKPHIAVFGERIPGHRDGLDGQPGTKRGSRIPHSTSENPAGKYMSEVCQRKTTVGDGDLGRDHRRRHDFYDSTNPICSFRFMIISGTGTQSRVLLQEPRQEKNNHQTEPPKNGVVIRMTMATNTGRFA